jgi:hypothetical protein
MLCALWLSGPARAGENSDPWLAWHPQSALLVTEVLKLSSLISVRLLGQHSS